MSDFHWQELDKEYGTKLITGTGDPTTNGIAPAVGGSLYLDRNGAALVSSGSAWVQIVANALSQSAADARYLQLTGGTLTGRVNVYPSVAGGPVLAVYNASTSAGSHAVQARPSANTNYGLAVLDATTAAVNAYIRGDGLASFASGSSIGGYSVNLGAGPFTGAPDALVALSGTTLQRYTQAALAAFLTGATLYPADVYTAGGHGLRSTDTGGAMLRFMSGASGYLEYLSGDSTLGGLRLSFNGTLRGSMYADSSGFGLLNNVGSWALRTNYGAGLGGTLYGDWVHNTRAEFNELLQFNVPSVSLIAGYTGAAQAANALITGSAQGDVCMRSENRTLRFSSDGGASSSMDIGNGAVTVNKPLNQMGYAVPMIVYSTSAPSGSAPAGTLWLKY